MKNEVYKILFSIFLAGNAFFIKRLVDKIDSTEAIVWSLRQEVAVLKISIENIHSQTLKTCGKARGTGFDPNVSERPIRTTFRKFHDLGF